MPRHVYKSDAELFRQAEVCKPQIDGNASALFFFQPVRINACECANE